MTDNPIQFDGIYCFELYEKERKWVKCQGDNIP